MTAPAWMPLYVSDYLADTGHLSTIEHGAYMLLIMHYWQNGELPTDDVKLSRIVRMSTKEWAAARDTIADLFQEGWHHKRIDRELAAASEVISKRSAAGKAAAAAMHAKRRAIATSNTCETQSDSGATEPSNACTSPSPSPEEDSSSVGNSTPRAREVTRIEREVRDAIGDKSPPENADFSPISSLIDAGYDPVKDVLAACRSAADNTTETIGSWQFYATAVSRKPKANGKPSEPVTWVSADSQRWGALADLYLEKRGKQLRASGSSHATGIGAFVPAAWLEIPEALRRT